MQQKKHNKEHMSGGLLPSVSLIFYWIIMIAIYVFAIYLSIKCNGGFDFIGFLGAICCNWCYIAYKLVSDWDKCFPKKII